MPAFHRDLYGGHAERDGAFRCSQHLTTARLKTAPQTTESVVGLAHWNHTADDRWHGRALCRLARHPRLLSPRSRPAGRMLSTASRRRCPPAVTAVRVTSSRRVPCLVGTTAGQPPQTRARPAVPA